MHRFGLAALLICLTGLIVSPAPPSARGDTLVLANRTGNKITFSLSAVDQKTPPSTPPAEARTPARQYQIAAGDCTPIRVVGRTLISYTSKDDKRTGLLEPNAMYYFAFVRGQLTLDRIGLGNEAMLTRAVGQPISLLDSHIADSPAAAKSPALAEVTVKILVDAAEPTTRAVWEKRLRDRIRDASKIFERTCFVRLRVVAVDTWKANHAITAFNRSLIEFERSVDPAPARLAIGFTSQYPVNRGASHLGGTHGPLNTHLLIRERSNSIGEPERLEVLVHELGHFLGSVHSPEPDSVMRPVLGDRQARALAFRIGFDPMNTLAMCLVGDELRERPQVTLAQFHFSRLELLHDLYGEMTRAMPGDTSAVRYVGFVERARQGSFILGAKQVCQAVVRAAYENAHLPSGTEDPTASRTRLDGDELADLYFRRGALAAQSLPSATSHGAYLLGMAVALDDMNTLGRNAKLGALCGQVESDAERKTRMAVLGLPTARGHHDLLGRFAISAGLDVLINAIQAESLCLQYEQQDAERFTRFSPAQYQAELAGICFAELVRRAPADFTVLADNFQVSKFLPPDEGLPEPMAWKDFVEHYGSFTDDRFRGLRQTMGQRIDSLLGKQPFRLLRHAPSQTAP